VVSLVKDPSFCLPNESCDHVSTTNNITLKVRENKTAWSHLQHGHTFKTAFSKFTFIYKYIKGFYYGKLEFSKLLTFEIRF